MDKRKMVLALVALVVVVAAAFGYSLSRPQGEAGTEKSQVAARKEERSQDACASSATYARLKQVAFEEAVRIRNADPTNLDTLAAQSVVRMENPVVKSRDEELNLTVCTGRFVLELPPGAERAFGGQRRLTADVEYAAQGAADGSGTVYQMEGAEPIIYKLASFDLQGQGTAPPPSDEEIEFAGADPSDVGLPTPAPRAPEADQTAPRREAPTVQQREAAPPRPTREATPAPRPAPPRRAERSEETRETPRPAPRPKAEARAQRPEPRPKAEAREERQEARPARAAARPSFNCRVGRSRSEQMVCNNARLAARDRAMSAQFYSALTDANPRARRELRRTRDRFLAYRERCRDEACIADAYEGRMREINDIMTAE